MSAAPFHREEFIRRYATPHLAELGGPQPLYRERAWSYCAAGRPEAFEQWVDQQGQPGWEDEAAFQLSSGAVALYLHMLGRERWALRRADAAFDRAEQLFSGTSDELEERLAAVHVDRGMAAKLADRPADAENAISKALELDPSRPSVWVHTLALWTGGGADLKRRLDVLQQKHCVWTLDRALRSALEVDGDLAAFRGTTAWRQMRAQMLPPLEERTSAKVEF